ncbi:MAG TPA: hypothetical protein VGE07_14465 [Herpetosiphonaceae bacterium]
MSEQSILALIPDLMFGVRVRDVLRQLGYQAQVVEELAVAREALRPGLGLLIVDLRADLAGWRELIAAAKRLEPAPKILAFGSHVDAERQQAARDAGCDRVVANSAFAAKLPQLVERTLKGRPGAQPEPEDDEA